MVPIYFLLSFLGIKLLESIIGIGVSPLSLHTRETRLFEADHDFGDDNLRYDFNVKLLSYTQAGSNPCIKEGRAEVRRPLSLRWKPPHHEQIYPGCCNIFNHLLDAAHALSSID